MTAEEIQTLHYSQVSVFDEDDHSISETFHEYSKLNRENIAEGIDWPPRPTERNLGMRHPRPCQDVLRLYGRR